MGGPNEAVRVSDKVYWVGAIDYNIRDFHGYHTALGSTYNAYLIKGEDNILVDTVKRDFSDELFSRVSSVVDLSDIRYIISNHAEPDHASSLAMAIEKIKPEKVFASKLGVQNLKALYGIEGVDAVEDGKEVKLGGVTLTHMETRMLHWPDSMMTYLADDKLLFSQDGLSMHLGSSERFADEIPMEVLEEMANRYFANILTPFSSLVLKLLDKVAAIGLEIDVVAPDHGPIWRRDVGRIIEIYRTLALQKPKKKAVIFYDSMWGNTEKMARAIGEGIADAGAEAKVMSLKANHRSDVAGELLDAGVLIVGSPTLNNNIFPSVADVLTYLKGLKFKDKAGVAFGSYGWSGEAGKLVCEMLESMKVELITDPLKNRFAPDAGMLDTCREFGKTAAAKLEEMVGDE
jgi:flavorubredoxin